MPSAFDLQQLIDAYIAEIRRIYGDAIAETYVVFYEGGWFRVKHQDRSDRIYSYQPAKFEEMLETLRHCPACSAALQQEGATDA